MSKKERIAIDLCIRKFSAFNDENGYRGMECSCGYASTTQDAPTDLENLNKHKCLDDDENLLPCPFCKGKARFGTPIHSGNYIECTKCWCRTKMIYWDFNIHYSDDVKRKHLTQELTSLWNNRS